MDLGPLIPQCAHARRERVDDLSGEFVAQLCLDCDAQLDAEWMPDPLPSFVSDPRMTYYTGR